MYFSLPLKPARLIKRYKRFLADILTQNDEKITIHCANTGAMTGCAEPGSIIWYSLSTNPKRKYSASWELSQTKQGNIICVNTTQANRVVKEAIEKKHIPELVGYQTIKQEVCYGDEKSRIDLLLASDNAVPCWIEIKSVTLCDEVTGMGYFPDTMTLRGQKHLRELITLRKKGLRAIIFFLIQHTGIKQFMPAAHIDKQYCQLLKQAEEVGVEILFYKTAISPKAIVVDTPISYRLPPI